MGDKTAGAVTKPRLSTDPWWRDDAACLGADTEQFFPDSYAHAPYRLHPVASKWCVNCPVLRACLEDALQDEIQQGIRGGLTPRQRRKILKRKKPS